MSTPDAHDTTFAAPQLTPELLRGIAKNGPTDPIEFYRRPIVGYLFRERINRALRLLPRRRFHKALEIGYGSGAVQLALSGATADLHGIDLDADPAAANALLAAAGRTATLRQGNVLDLPYESETFDLVVSFSVFEHLYEYPRALDQVVRVLAPGGLFLLGMPAVNDMMSVGFRAIGFRDIGHHHVTSPALVAARFEPCGLNVVSTAHFEVPVPSPVGFRIYSNWLLQRG